ncbi:hypothetical protein CPB86DRAFT_792185 [Serendipita vermifera]|nr:hypothetical protein CPB86DRAFT_792185 [Serendipita vermifera]
MRQRDGSTKYKKISPAVILDGGDDEGCVDEEGRGGSWELVTAEKAPVGWVPDTTDSNMLSVAELRVFGLASIEDDKEVMLDP